MCFYAGMMSEGSFDGGSFEVASFEGLFDPLPQQLTDMSSVPMETNLEAETTVKLQTLEGEPQDLYAVD